MASIPSITLFYGNDRPLLYKRFQELEKSLLSKVPALQTHSFDEASLGEIINFVQSGSLFGDTFCIKVAKIKGKDPLSLWKDVPHFLLIHSSEEDDPYAKVSFPFLQKIACSLPKPWEFIKLLRQFFGQTLTSEALEYLSSNLSSTLEMEELEKQRQFLKIPQLNLENLVRLLPDNKANDFLLADYFFIPEKIFLFFRTLHRLKELSYSLEGFWNILFKKTQDFLQISRGLLDKTSIQNLSKELKIHPFVLEKNILIVKHYSKQELEKLFKKLPEIQYLSRFYASKMDYMLATRLFFEKKASFPSEAFSKN